MHKIAFLISLMLTFPVLATDCTKQPSCAELGYTSTSCSGKSLACPFDTKYKHCLETCESGSTNTCADYPLTTCPANAKCATCPSDSGRKKVSSCNEFYTLRNNVCYPTSCEVYTNFKRPIDYLWLKTIVQTRINALGSPSSASGDSNWTKQKSIIEQAHQTLLNSVENYCDASKKVYFLNADKYGDDIITSCCETVAPSSSSLLTYVCNNFDTTWYEACQKAGGDTQLCENSGYRFYTEWCTAAIRGCLEADKYPYNKGDCPARDLSLWE